MPLQGGVPGSARASRRPKLSTQSGWMIRHSRKSWLTVHRNTFVSVNTDLVRRQLVAADPSVDTQAAGAGIHNVHCDLEVTVTPEANFEQRTQCLLLIVHMEPHRRCRARPPQRK